MAEFIYLMTFVICRCCFMCGKCSVSVHSTHFWCTVWKVFCFCEQYTFLMYRLESVLFLCTVHISGAQCLSNRFLVQVLCCSRCFVVMLPWWRQFQSQSKHVTAVFFLKYVTDTKYSAHICHTVSLQSNYLSLPNTNSTTNICSECH